MNRTVAAYLVLFALVLLSIVHMAVYYPILPEKVASHFNAQGQVDAWMEKGAFMAVYAGTVLGTAVLFLAIGFGLSHVPVSMISLPNRDYWLAPERKKETWAFVTVYFMWFANATLLFVMFCFHASFAASLGRDPFPWLFPTALTVYLLFTLVWCLRLFRRFRKPRQS